VKILILKKRDCPYSQNALDFLRQTNHTIGSLDCEKRFDKFPKDLGWKPDVIFSFKNYMILPKEITQSTFCVNFHPGPPEHPGSCSANWALYYQDKTFGVTAHLMNGLVDNGLIFRVRRFPIKPETTLMEVLKKADQEVLKLFKEIVGDITTEWKGKARVGKELDSLIQKKPNDPRVLRATKFIKKK